MNNEGGGVLTPKKQPDEIARLKAENLCLKKRERDTFTYIRSKVDQLLEVMGTLPLKQGELDDNSLLETDPIGTVADSFRLILGHLHKTNDKLRLANSEIGAILDTAGAGILVVDKAARVTTLNNKATELFSIRRDAAIGRPCHDAICCVGAPPDGCVLQMVLSGGGKECRNEWIWNDRHFEVVGRPLRNGIGDISHVVIVYAEITDRIRYEEQLRHALANAREARDQVNGILHSVADGLLVTDLEQRITLTNPQARQLFGGVGPLEGRNLADVIDDAEMRRAIQKTVQSGEPTKSDFTSNLFGKSIFEGRISLLRGVTGDPAGLVVIMHDVTQERAVERMKSEFVATAAHEFRTPLTTILGFSELMLDSSELSEKERREFLRLIHEKADSLSRIVNNLLDISRIESGEELPLDLRDCSLEGILNLVVPSHIKQDTAHSFVLSLPEEEVHLRVDLDGVVEVFENLLSNAIKYSPEGGEITIACEQYEKFCRISISDQGVGIPQESLTRVFDKFYRADNANTAIRGTGLGLTIVRYILEAHGGRIWLDSCEGEGTTVLFTLPLAVDEPPGEKIQSDSKD